MRNPVLHTKAKTKKERRQLNKSALVSLFIFLSYISTTAYHKAVLKVVFFSWHLTPGSITRGGTKGQNLEHLHNTKEDIHVNVKINQNLSRVMRKQTFWFPTWSDTNQADQSQKMARGLKFRIWKVEGLCYLCSENTGADQLRGYREADLRLCFYKCKMLVFSRRGSKF